MTSEQIIRSWRDEDYLLGLSAAEQALLPANPAGRIELTDEEMLGIEGGAQALPPTIPIRLCSPFCPLTWVGCNL
jgi:mersacidin/lichenicidin family type 2 lantibiotic